MAGVSVHRMVEGLGNMLASLSEGKGPRREDIQRLSDFHKTFVSRMALFCVAMKDRAITIFCTQPSLKHS